MAAWIYAGMTPGIPGRPDPSRTRSKAKKVPQGGWQQGGLSPDMREETAEADSSDPEDYEEEAVGDFPARAWKRNDLPKKQPRKPASFSGQSGIHDEKDDWLSRQMKEEEAALWRVREMFGWPGMSDARALKMEHEKRHNAAKRKGAGW